MHIRNKRCFHLYIVVLLGNIINKYWFNRKHFSVPIKYLFNRSRYLGNWLQHKGRTEAWERYSLQGFTKLRNYVNWKLSSANGCLEKISHNRDVCFYFKRMEERPQVCFFSKRKIRNKRRSSKIKRCREKDRRKAGKNKKKNERMKERKKKRKKN